MDAMFAETLVTNMPDVVVYSNRDVRPCRSRSGQSLT
jgi:hypothetical protein